MKHIVDKIIAEKGKSVDAAIPILQAIQAEFNYLLKRLCKGFVK